MRAITNFVANRQKSLRTSCFYDRIVERTVKSGRGRNYHAENCRRYQVRRRQQHVCLEAFGYRIGLMIIADTVLEEYAVEDNRGLKIKSIYVNGERKLEEEL